MKTIEQLTDAHEATAQELIEAVKETYPVGAIIDARLHGKEVWIRAKVESHWASSRYPHQMTVRNVKTGKVRNISACPYYGHSVELVSLPENVPEHAPSPAVASVETEGPR